MQHLMCIQVQMCMYTNLTKTATAVDVSFNHTFSLLWCFSIPLPKPWTRLRQLQHIHMKLLQPLQNSGLCHCNAHIRHVSNDDKPTLDLTKVMQQNN